MREIQTIAGFTKKLREICEKYDKKIRAELGKGDKEEERYVDFNIYDVDEYNLNFFLEFNCWIKTAELRDLIEELEATLGAEGTYNWSQGEGRRFHFIVNNDSI